MTHVAEVGRPAAVLVHGKQAILFLGKGNEALTDFQVEHKGFLREDVFARTQGVFNDGDALRWMGGGIDDVDVIALQELTVVIKDLGFGIKAVAMGLGFGNVSAA